MSYHYYYRCRLGLVKCWEQQTGTHRVVILFNSSQIAQRCVFWKSLLDVCKCECVWGYEAALLFPGQLLVTQEWLICNGCCHSPAVAPGDGCTVTNVHTLTLSLRAHTTQKFKTHAQKYVHSRWCTYIQRIKHFTNSLKTSDKVPCFSRQSSLRWGQSKGIWITPITLLLQQTWCEVTST